MRELDNGPRQVLKLEICETFPGELLDEQDSSHSAHFVPAALLRCHGAEDASLALEPIHFDEELRFSKASSLRGPSVSPAKVLTRREARADPLSAFWR